MIGDVVHSPNQVFFDNACGAVDDGCIGGRRAGLVGSALLAVMQSSCHRRPRSRRDYFGGTEMDHVPSRTAASITLPGFRISSKRCPDCSRISTTHSVNFQAKAALKTRTE